MTGQELLDYVAECKKRNLTPEVWAGSIRFDIMDVDRKENDLTMVVVEQAFMIVEDDKPGWEYNNRKQGNALRPVPFRFLAKEWVHTES